MTTHILFVETTNEIGGGQVGLLDLIKGIDTKQFSFSIILPQKSGPLFQQLRDLKQVTIYELDFSLLPLNLHKRPFLPLYNFIGTYRLSKLIKQIKPDIVHANHILAGKIASKAASLAKIPSIVTMRNVYYTKKLNFNFFVDQRLCKFANKIVFNSYLGRDIFKERTSSEKAISIRNGIHTFQKPKVEKINSIYEKYQIQKDKKIISCIGVLSEIKGHYILLKSFAKVLQNTQNVHLIMVGDEYLNTGHKQQLKQLCKRLNITSNVTFVGFQNDTSPYYEISYCTVFPSIIGEGLPRAIIESLHAGKPVVASKLAAIPEIIDNNENGYLTPPNNIEKLTSNLIKTLSLAPEIYNRMCNSATQKALKAFEFSSMIKSYENLYSTVCNNEKTK